MGMRIKYTVVVYRFSVAATLPSYIAGIPPFVAIDASTVVYRSKYPPLRSYESRRGTL